MGRYDAVPAHRRRANGVQLQTEARSRRSVQPFGHFMY
jgi:hypothetical protein